MTALYLKEVVAYTDTIENEFAINLWNIIKNNYSITVISNQFSNVDYLITNKVNKKYLYIELKNRNISFKNSNTFIIGKNKLNRIFEKKLLPTILIWKFDTDLFFIEVDISMLKYDSALINNSEVYFIPRDDCIKSTYSNPQELIKSIHSITSHS